MDLVNHLDNRLLFAIPKKGRLHQACLEVLSGSDIKFHRHNRLDIALVHNLPIALVFLPAADIPRFVGEGNVDLGITGQDTIEEALLTSPDLDIEELLDLGFGSCKLQAQVPVNSEMQSVRDLVGKRVVTSFEDYVAAHFRRLEKDMGVPSGATKVKYVSGSVEAACALGLADGIVDLVESGETMKAAGLRAIETLLDTTAVLVRSKHPRRPDMIPLITRRVSGYVTAQKYLLLCYNCPREQLKVCTAITPGRRAATVSPLEDGTWVAVSAMVLRKEAAVVMDKLESAGASDILVHQIANSRA